MSICPKNKSSKSRRDKRRANWKMSAPNLVKCSKCGALMMPHRECILANAELWTFHIVHEIKNRYGNVSVFLLLEIKVSKVLLAL